MTQAREFYIKQINPSAEKFKKEPIHERIIKLLDDYGKLITSELLESDEEKKLQITRDCLKEFPLETIGQVAMLKIAEMSVNVNSAETTLSTEATFNEKRYAIKMVVKIKKAKNP